MSLPTESTLDNIELSLAGLDVSKDVKIVDYWFYVEHNGILKNISLSTTNWEKISNIDIQKNHPQWVMKVILTDKSKCFRAKSQLNDIWEVEIIDDFQSTDWKKIHTSCFEWAKSIDAFWWVIRIPRLSSDEKVEFFKNQLNEKWEVQIIDLKTTKWDHIIWFKSSIWPLTNAFWWVIWVTIEDGGERRAKLQLNKNGEIEIINLKTTEWLKVADIRYVQEEFWIVSLKIVDIGPWDQPESVFANSKLNEEWKVEIRDIHTVGDKYYERDASGNLTLLRKLATVDNLTTTDDLTWILQENKES